MQRIFFAVLFFFLIFSTAFAQDKFITIGSGGGFTGTTTVFKITPGGLIFKGEGLGDIKFSEWGKIKKSKAKEILTTVSDAMSSKTSSSHPGNLFYFISYTENNNKFTITWGDADHPVQADVKELYEEVLTTVSAVKYKPIQ